MRRPDGHMTPLPTPSMSTSTRYRTRRPSLWPPSELHPFSGANRRFDLVANGRRRVASMATSTVSIVATGLRKGSNRDGSPAHGPRRKILIGISASTVRDVALSNTFSQPNSLFDHDEIAPDEEEPKSHCCPGIEDHRSQAISDNRLDKENECREGER